MQQIEIKRLRALLEQWRQAMAEEHKPLAVIRAALLIAEIEQDLRENQP